MRLENDEKTPADLFTTELLNTLKGRIQAAQNIQSGIFPGLSRQVQIFVNNS